MYTFFMLEILKVETTSSTLWHEMVTKNYVNVQNLWNFTCLTVKFHYPNRTNVNAKLNHENDNRGQM